jgi:uncharacterized protein YndB with AHSA1/START domain
VSKPQFVYVSYIKTTPEKLWAALTEGEFTRQYWFGYRIESDWTAGSELKFYAPDGTLAHLDRVLRVEKPKILSYTWTPIPTEELRGEAPSTVTFELEPQGQVVKLTVTHFNFPDGSKVFPQICNGWPAVLSSLKTWLESGTALTIGAFSNGKTCQEAK